MPPITKLIKSKKTGRYGLTSDDGATVEVLDPNARLIKGRSGKWGITSDSGATVEVLEDFDPSTVDSAIVYTPQQQVADPLKKNDGTAPASGGMGGVTASTTNPIPAAGPSDVHVPTDATAIETKLPTLAPELYEQVQKAKVAPAVTTAPEDFTTTVGKGDNVNRYTSSATSQAANEHLQTMQDMSKVDQQAAEMDINRFAEKLVAKYDNGKYIDIDGKERTAFNEGDIIVVPKDVALSNGKKYPTGYAQFTGNDWLGTAAPDPNFVLNEQQPEGSMDASVVGYRGKGFLATNLRKADADISNEDYDKALAQLDKYPKVAGITFDNKWFDGSKKQPFFLLQNPEILPVYEQLLTDRPTYSKSADGAYTALNNAIVKTYKLDESIWNTDDGTLINNQEFTRNVDAANKLQDLSAQVADLQKTAETASPENKASIQQKIQNLQQQAAQYQPATLQAYFARPEIKGVVARTAQQQKGYAVLSQVQKMFPKRMQQEDEMLKKVEDGSDPNAMQVIADMGKSFGYGAKEGFTKTGTAISNIAEGGDDNAVERANSEMMRDMAQQDFIPVYKDNGFGNFANSVLRMTGEIAPTFLMGGSSTGAQVAGRVFNAATFGLNAYEDTQEQYNAEGVPKGDARVAGLINGVLMGAIGAVLPGGGTGVEGFKPTWHTVQKILNPELSAAGRKAFTRELLEYNGGALLKSIPEGLKAATEMKVVSAVNAVANTLTNNKYGSQLNTDSGSAEDFITTALSFAVQNAGMKAINFRSYSDADRMALVHDAAAGRMSATITRLEALQQEPGADVAGIQKAIDDVQRFAGIRFPATATPEQRAVVYLQYEQKRQLQEAQSQTPEFASAYDGRIKEVDKRIAELLTKPEEAAKEVEAVTAPVQEQVQRGISVLMPERDETVTKTIGGGNENNQEATQVQAGNAAIRSGTNRAATNESVGPTDGVAAENVNDGTAKSISQLDTTGSIETPDYRIEKDGETYRIIEPDKPVRLATRETVEEYLKLKQGEQQATQETGGNGSGDVAPSAQNAPQPDLPIQATKPIKTATGTEVLPMAEQRLNESTIVPQVEGTETPTSEAVVPTESGAVETADTKTQVNDATEQRVDDSLPAVERPNPAAGEATSMGEQPAPTSTAASEVSGKTVEKTVVKGRAYDGTVRQEVKDALEKQGLTRTVKNQAEAYDNAGAFVKEVGEDYALQAVRNKDVEGDNAIAVYAHLIKAVQDRGATETDPHKSLDLANHEANLIQEVDALGTFGGRIGSMFGYIYRNSDLSFNVEKKIQDYKKEFGGMTAEEEARFREIDALVKEKDKQIAELLEKNKQQEDEFVKLVKKQDARTGSRTATQRAKTIADNVRRLKTRELKFYDADGSEIQVQTAGFTWNEVVELAAKAIEKTGEIADGIRVAVERLKEQEWYGRLSDRDKEAVQSQLQILFSPEPEPAARTEDGKPKITHSQVRAKVEAGAKNIEEVVEAFKEDYPDVSDRDIRDAVTKYGVQIGKTRSQIEKDISEMKNIGRMVSALEDIVKGERPLKSGLHREPPTVKEREMRKKVNDKLKDLPIDTETEDRQLRTALDAAERKKRNRIEELKEAIKTGIAIVRNNRKLETTERLKELQKELDAEQEEYDRIFGEPELSEGQKKIRSLEKQLNKLLTGEQPATKEPSQYTDEEKTKIDALQQQIKDEQVMQGLREPPRIPKTAEELRLGQIDNAIEKIDKQIVEGKLEAKRGTALTTPKIEARLKRLNERRTDLKQLREEAGIIEAQRLARIKKQVIAATAEYKRRRTTGDFATVEKKKVITDDELTRLRADKEAEKELYDKEFEKARLSAVKRWSAEWWKDKAWGAYDLTRSLRATGEMSFVLMQGGMLSIAHPFEAFGKPKDALRYVGNKLTGKPTPYNIEAASAFRTMLHFMASEKNAEGWAHKAMQQDWWPQAKKAGLALTSSNAKLTAREELFNSQWTKSIWNMIGAPEKLYPGEYEKWVKRNPANALERAATGYLNMLRVQRYLDGVKILETRKAEGEDITEQDYKDVADVVNTLTGRGSLGRLEQQSELLSKIFFSPRLWSSAIKTATPYGIYHFGKMTPVARRMALTDFSRYVGVTAGMVAMAAAGMNNDDNKDGVELDPRSSDFGKIRVGDVRIDPWGGRIQQVVLQARLIMGVLGNEAYKDSKGELKKLGQDTKSPTMAGLLGTMATNKLAPTAAILNRYLNTKINSDDERVDMYGQPYSLKKEVLGNLYPIYWDTIKEMAADKDGLKALDGLLLFYSFFGGGVNQYQQKIGGGPSLTQQRQDAIEEIAAAAKQDKYAVMNNSDLKEKMQQFNITNDDLQRELSKPVFDKEQQKFAGLSTEKKIDKWATMTPAEREKMAATLSATGLSDFQDNFVRTPDFKSAVDDSGSKPMEQKNATYEELLQLYGNPKRAALRDMIRKAPAKEKK